MIHWPQTETHTRKYIHWIDCVWECIANTAPPTITTLTLLFVGSLVDCNNTHWKFNVIWAVTSNNCHFSRSQIYFHMIFHWKPARVRRLFFGSGFSISFYNVHSSRTSPLLLTWFNLVIQFPWHVLSRHWLDVARVYSTTHTHLISLGDKKNGSQRK